MEAARLAYRAGRRLVANGVRAAEAFPCAPAAAAAMTFGRGGFDDRRDCADCAAERLTCGSATTLPHPSCPQPHGVRACCPVPIGNSRAFSLPLFRSGSHRVVLRRLRDGAQCSGVLERPDVRRIGGARQWCGLWRFHDRAALPVCADRRLSGTRKWDRLVRHTRWADSGQGSCGRRGGTHQHRCSPRPPPSRHPPRGRAPSTLWEHDVTIRHCG